MEWIELTDDKPDVGKRVLVEDSNYGVQIGWLTNAGRWQLAYQMPTVAMVERWMHLPKGKNEQQ